MNKIFVVIVLAILIGNLFAQKKIEPAKKDSIFLGVVESISSIELKEKRKLNIYLPDNYSPDSAKTYPVIYLLDGSVNEDFIHIAGIVQFLTMIEKMPPSIVVGIANIDRRRDFTYPTTIQQDKKDFPTTGSSEKFIRFIKNELQPFIDKKYKTNDSKTIIGQSLGGLVATEILFKNPGLFNQYLIVSPSLWWDNESLLKQPVHLLGSRKDSMQVYISAGNEGRQMEADVIQLTAIINAIGNKQIRVKYMPLPNENHLTILHNSVYKGFEILFSNPVTPK